MQAVLLAGGLGTRISEETHLKPKPMVEIGGRPILWHIMKLYSHHGINDFIICLGYKGYVIKEYFANYFLHMSDVTFDMSNNQMCVHKRKVEPWKITLIDTGEHTLTGGRLKRVQEHLGKDPFCFTYGDGLSDINIQELIKFHKSHGKQATVTAIQPPGRYGNLEIKDQITHSFQEKPVGDGAWINGGFFVLTPSVLDLIEGDDCSWEEHPLRILTQKKELMAYQHHGFWQAMDTLRDKHQLNNLWDKKQAPWKVWK